MRKQVTQVGHGSYPASPTIERYSQEKRTRGESLGEICLNNDKDVAVQEAGEDGRNTLGGKSDEKIMVLIAGIPVP